MKQQVEPSLQIAGVVLAGGLSNRMGQDKACMDWQGQSLLSRTQQLLIDSGVDQVLVSRNQPDCPDYIKDIYPQTGPLGGIHGVMSQHRFDGYVFVPVDMPKLTPTLLSGLIENGQTRRTMCCYTASYLPLYVPFYQQIIDYMTQQLAHSGKRSVHHMLAHFEYHQIANSDIEAFKNVNQPSDWQQL